MDCARLHSAVHLDMEVWKLFSCDLFVFKLLTASEANHWSEFLCSDSEVFCLHGKRAGGISQSVLKSGASGLRVIEEAAATDVRLNVGRREVICTTFMLREYQV